MGCDRLSRHQQVQQGGQQRRSVRDRIQPLPAGILPPRRRPRGPGLRAVRQQPGHPTGPRPEDVHLCLVAAAGAAPTVYHDAEAGAHGAMRLVILVANGGQLRDEYSARLMACLSDRHVRSHLKTVGFPATVHFVLIAKERIAVVFLSTTRLRRGSVSRWLAGATTLSLCALAGAYLAPQTANAAGPSRGVVAPGIPRGATVLPDGRYVRPAGIRYNLGDFSLGLAIAPNGRCAASSDEGWGNGRPVPAVPKVNRAGTQPDEGVTALNLVTGATQFVTVNRKPAQNFMGIGLAYSHEGTRLYATSGGTAAVYQFNVGSDCRLTYAATGDLPSQAPPARTSSFTGTSAAYDRGLAVSADGTVLVTTEYGRALNAVSVDRASNLTTAKVAVAFGTPTIVPHGTNILNFLKPPTPNDTNPSYLYAVATATDPATAHARAYITAEGTGQLITAESDGANNWTKGPTATVGDHPT